MIDINKLINVKTDNFYFLIKTVQHIFYKKDKNLELQENIKEFLREIIFNYDNNRDNNILFNYFNLLDTNLGELSDYRNSDEINLTFANKLYNSIINHEKIEIVNYDNPLSFVKFDPDIIDCSTISNFKLDEIFLEKRNLEYRDILTSQNISKIYLFKISIFSLLIGNIKNKNIIEILSNIQDESGLDIIVEDIFLNMLKCNKLYINPLIKNLILTYPLKYEMKISENTKNLYIKLIKRTINIIKELDCYDNFDYDIISNIERRIENIGKLRSVDKLRNKEITDTIMDEFLLNYLIEKDKNIKKTYIKINL